MADTQLAPIQATPVVLVDNTDADKIALYRSQLDINDAQSILMFGTGLQKKANDISVQMLDGVKSRDTGPVGELLVDVVTGMRKLDFGKIAPGQKVSLWGKIRGQATPIVEFFESYEEVNTHVNVVVNDLEKHNVVFLKDVKMLDSLYDATLDFYRELGNAIAALKEELAQLDTVTIPALTEKATHGDLLDAQTLRDKIGVRDAIERKDSDLEMTRQVVMQSLPSIRMIQQNDKDLIGKNNTLLLVTIPAWQRQMAISVAAWRMAEGAKTAKVVSDFQNDLLMKSAETLRIANAATRTEVERGVYDIAAVKAAQDSLLGAINDTVTIANEGKAKRADAAVQLEQLQSELKQALIGAANAA